MYWQSRQSYWFFLVAQGTLSGSKSASLSVASNHSSVVEYLDFLLTRAQTMYKAGAYLHWYWRYRATEVRERERERVYMLHFFPYNYYIDKIIGYIINNFFHSLIFNINCKNYMYMYYRSSVKSQYNNMIIPNVYPKNCKIELNLLIA